MGNFKYLDRVISGSVYMKRYLIALSFLFLLISGSVYADELSFAPLFNDGVVLQCEMPVNVWGKANPGQMVKIVLDRKKQTEVKADQEGIWQAVMKAHSAGGPHILEATSNKDRISIRNVYFGEVWLATGQSNMVQPLRNAEGGEERLNSTNEDLRFVIVPKRTGFPVEGEFTSKELQWKTFAPPENNEIASVAFFFAEYLQSCFDCKIGIIQSSYGGTPAQAWTPLHALDNQPGLKYYADYFREGLSGKRTKEDFLAEVEEFNNWFSAMQKWRESGEGVQPVNPGPVSESNLYSSKTSAILYENMIKPLIPYTARGVIWYQGESNAGNPDEYRILSPTMINAWREAWNRPDWPFLFVQLAAYAHPIHNWPELRASQAFVRDVLPYTGMAVAIDKGEKQDIHPRFKQPVGERLARLALDQVYSVEIASRGPHYEKIEVFGTKVIINFVYTMNGLQTANDNPIVPGFEIAGSDGIFYPAKAKITSETTIELTSKQIDKAVTVRYGWYNWIEPPLTLVNSEGLPAEPFLVSFSEKR